MTDAASPDLGHTKIRQLLAAVGSAPVQTDSNPEATPYEWQDPHYFNDDQCNRMAAVMSQVGVLLSE